MKVISKRLIRTDELVYDVVNASPHHNFLIPTNTGSIVSHNCGLLRLSGRS